MDFLVAKRVVSSMVVDGQKIYKVSSSDNNVEEGDFEEADAGIIRLHLTIQHLNVEIEDLETEVKCLEMKVKQELKVGSRLVAKNHLRRRKTAELNLNKKFSQLHNLENVMESVMRAEGSKAVVEAYKGGLEALKAISSKSPSLEEVEGLVGEVGVPGVFSLGRQSRHRGLRRVGPGGLGVPLCQSRGIVVRLCMRRLPGGIRLRCRGPG